MRKWILAAAGAWGRLLWILAAVWIAVIANALLHAPAKAARPTPPANAPATSVIAVPADAIARSKFPDEDRLAVDVVAWINKVVNRSIVYTRDDTQYGRREHWVMLPESGKGDCEDYVLSKLALLIDAGVPAVAHTKIVHVMSGLEGHAILAVRLPKGGVAYLDNGYDDLMTRPELEARGYKFFDW